MFRGQLQAKLHQGTNTYERREAFAQDSIIEMDKELSAMAYQVLNGIKVWGIPDEEALAQAVACANTGQTVETLLLADHHKGPSLPTGGVIVYDGQISPSAVGYDIACGIKALRTGMLAEDIRGKLSTIMDDIAKQISFGVGRVNNTKVDHYLFDDSHWDIYKDIGRQEHDILKELAVSQLGTVGSGNHFVDLLEETTTGELWIAAHFGSRGFGFKTAAGFINLAGGRKFLSNPPSGINGQPPIVLDMKSDLGQMYYKAIQLVGLYASAGRDYVTEQVLHILGAGSNFEVHNSHNYAWEEVHDGNSYMVVRKGATPTAPGQLAYISGSMDDVSVIVQGKNTQENRDAFYSSAHAAGKISNKGQAFGPMNWTTRVRSGGRFSYQETSEYSDGLRGTALEEDSAVYRKLQDVLEIHEEALEVLNILRPIGVCMAANEFDPYSDYFVYPGQSGTG
jgi:tRNA-splicing ligase RtcB